MIQQDLPLIDLHRHLDGNVRISTIIDLGQQHGIPLPSFEIEALRPHVQVWEPQPGVMAFISKFKWMMEVLVDFDACRRIAYENVADAYNEGIDYIELRFSPLFMAEAHQLNTDGVVEAVIDGVRAGEREFGVRVNLIGIISRTYGPENGNKELTSLLRYRDELVAIDLAGDEIRFPGNLFQEHFRKIRDAGLRVTVHAGESVGAESIWQAVTQLGASRIGHGVRAIDDPELMQFMRENAIGIESNLTSNVQTCTVPDYQSHPLKPFLEFGLLATINTDDPGVSAITLPHEYQVAAPAAGLTPSLIRQAQENAVRTAFLSESEKQSLLTQKARSTNNSLIK